MRQSPEAAAENGEVLEATGPPRRLAEQEPYSGSRAMQTAQLKVVRLRAKLRRQIVYTARIEVFFAAAHSYRVRSLWRKSSWPQPGNCLTRENAAGHARSLRRSGIGYQGPWRSLGK